MIRNWGRYAPYFSELEFDCKHCGKNEMQPEFMDALLRLRVAFNRPMIISSGYRCPDHNDRVSSSGIAGPHTTGLAADVHVTGTEARLLLELADEFHRIGVNQRGAHSGRFIHLDILPKPGTVWSY